jgi:hypothetical protein
MNKQGSFTIKFQDVPLGSWNLNGNWFHNSLLMMSESEQREHNVKGGHFDKMKCSPGIVSLKAVP